MTRSAVSALAIVLALPALALADGRLDEKAIDALARDALVRWDVPGLAVVVVRGDEVVYLKGHGVRELGRKEPVTADTAFPLASLTKAFAAATVALLVDEGKMDWDDKVSKHLPAFRLSDPLADREVRLRDLLCHRAGLARHDLLWYRAPWSLEETVKRMASLELRHPFRTRYEYCNLGYIAAGQAVAAASGMSWEQFTRKRLLEPLGMKDAAFTRTQVLARKDRAMPHRALGGKARAVEWYPDDKQVRGSGSLKTSAREMAGWLRLNLAGGVLGGKRLISAEAMRQMHTPQVVAPPDAAAAKLAGTTQQSYCLGWRLLDHRGAAVLEHGGAADGFRSRAVLLPGSKAAFVVFANLEETRAVQALGNLLIEELLGVPKRDWHGFYLKQRAVAREVEEARKKALALTRKKGTKPSLRPAGYAGRYVDRAYGEAVVKADGGLKLAWSAFEVRLEHFHDDTFVVKAGSGRLDGALVRFELGRDGRVAAMHFLERRFARGK